MQHFYPLFTLGYATWTIAQVEAVLDRTDALLADIRSSPRSNKPGFDRFFLSLHLGERYRHVSALGNVNYKGGPIQLREERMGLDWLRKALVTQPVVLMCGCKDLRQCHRLTVADLVHAQFGVEAVHLESKSITGQQER